MKKMNLCFIFLPLFLFGAWNGSFEEAPISCNLNGNNQPAWSDLSLKRKVATEVDSISYSMIENESGSELFNGSGTQISIDLNSLYLKNTNVFKLLPRGTNIGACKPSGTASALTQLSVILKPDLSGVDKFCNGPGRVNQNECRLQISIPKANLYDNTYFRQATTDGTLCYTNFVKAENTGIRAYLLGSKHKEKLNAVIHSYWLGSGTNTMNNLTTNNRCYVLQKNINGNLENSVTMSTGISIVNQTNSEIKYLDLTQTGFTSFIYFHKNGNAWVIDDTDISLVLEPYRQDKNKPYDCSAGVSNTKMFSLMYSMNPKSCQEDTPTNDDDFPSLNDDKTKYIPSMIIEHAARPIKLEVPSKTSIKQLEFFWDNTPMNVKFTLTRFYDKSSNKTVLEQTEEQTASGGVFYKTNSANKYVLSDSLKQASLDNGYLYLLEFMVLANDNVKNYKNLSIKQTNSDDSVYTYKFQARPQMFAINMRHVGILNCNNLSTRANYITKYQESNILEKLYGIKGYSVSSYGYYSSKCEPDNATVADGGVTFHTNTHLRAGVKYYDYVKYKNKIGSEYGDLNSKEMVEIGKIYAAVSNTKPYRILNNTNTYIAISGNVKLVKAYDTTNRSENKLPHGAFSTLEEFVEDNEDAKKHAISKPLKANCKDGICEIYTGKDEHGIPYISYDEYGPTQMTLVDDNYLDHYAPDGTKLCIANSFDAPRFDMAYENDGLIGCNIPLWTVMNAGYAYFHKPDSKVLRDSIFTFMPYTAKLDTNLDDNFVFYDNVDNNKSLRKIHNRTQRAKLDTTLTFLNANNERLYLLDKEIFKNFIGSFFNGMPLIKGSGSHFSEITNANDVYFEFEVDLNQTVNQDKKHTYQELRSIKFDSENPTYSKEPKVSLKTNVELGQIKHKIFFNLRRDEDPKNPFVLKPEFLDIKLKEYLDYSAAFIPSRSLEGNSRLSENPANVMNKISSFLPHTSVICFGDDFSHLYPNMPKNKTCKNKRHIEFYSGILDDKGKLKNELGMKFKDNTVTYEHQGSGLAKFYYGLLYIPRDTMIQTTLEAGDFPFYADIRASWGVYCDNKCYNEVDHKNNVSSMPISNNYEGRIEREYDNYYLIKAYNNGDNLMGAFHTNKNNNSNLDYPNSISGSNYTYNYEKINKSLHLNCGALDGRITSKENCNPTTDPFNNKELFGTQIIRFSVNSFGKTKFDMYASPFSKRNEAVPCNNNLSSTKDCLNNIPTPDDNQEQIAHVLKHDANYYIKNKNGYYFPIFPYSVTFDIEEDKGKAEGGWRGYGNEGNINGLKQTNKSANRPKRIQ